MLHNLEFALAAEKAARINNHKGGNGQKIQANRAKRQHQTVTSFAKKQFINKLKKPPTIRKNIYNKPSSTRIIPRRLSF